MKNIIVALTLGFSLVACAQNKEDQPSHKDNLELDSLQTAYFASGCFWCVEAIFESVEGVHEAVSGYSGGVAKNANYNDVSRGKTKHAEAVLVYYDSSIVSYETLLDVFFNSHDPSTLNQQGPDKGTQYRSAIFYQTEQEHQSIEQHIDSLKSNKVFSKITTQVLAFDAFYQAEDYHQDYEHKNPNNPYVQAVSLPRLNAFKQKMPEVLK